MARSHCALLPSLTAALAGALAAALPGCGAAGPAGPGGPPGPAAAGLTPAARMAQRLAADESRSGEWIETGAAFRARAEEAGAGAMALGGAPPPSVAAPRARGPMESAAGSAAGSAVPSSIAQSTADGDGRPAQLQETLHAGEVDDNRLFEKYLAYAKEYGAGGGVRRFDAAERCRIRVVNEAGFGVPDAEVILSAPGSQQGPLYRGRTAANGEALFFPAAAGVPVPPALALDVRGGGARASATVERRDRGAEWTVTLAGGARSFQGMTLDVLFLVDTTGSMSEEIDRVRDTIHSVSAQIRALPARPKLRLGMVLYRDRGDEYVTRRKPFTEDVQAFHAALEEVRADGGGDEPEDLNAGLQQAIEAMDWTPAGAVRMLFAIADAPPHLDYDQEYDYFLGGQRAVEKGIKVIGVSTVGTNDVGEFVFRQLALLTGGRFVFVTRGADGGTPHHVDRGDYSVQKLDSLIVRLVREELASLGTKPAEAGPQARR